MGLIACLASFLLAAAATAQPREIWKGQPDGVSALAVSPDGKTLASSIDDGSVILWDLATAKKDATLVSDQRRAGHVAFTPDGKSLVAIGQRPEKPGEQQKEFFLCSAKVWDVKTRKQRLTIDFQEGGAAGGLITPDSKSLIAGGPKTPVVLYDLTTGKPSEPLGLGEDNQDARTMALSPDGKTLAVGTQSGDIVLWDMDKKAVRAKISIVRFRPAVLAFSPDGKTIASASSLSTGVVELWDAASGKSAGTLDVEPRLLLIRAIAFSPDGKTIALGGWRWGVSLWDVAAGGERDDFEGDLDTGGVLCAVFTPDGKTLITGGIDRAKGIWFWDVPKGKPKGLKPYHQTTPLEVKQLHDRFPPKP